MVATPARRSRPFINCRVIARALTLWFHQHRWQGHVGAAPLNPSVDFQGTRDSVRQAKLALRDAEYRFDADCDPDNCITLMSEIRTAEQRLAGAN
jgi:hypothetical protein